MQDQIEKIDTDEISLPKEKTPFLEKVNTSDISLDDLWGNFERHLDEIGGSQLSNSTKDALFQGLLTGYQVFRPENKKLKSKIASFNIRVGYIAYSVIEKLREEHGKRDKIIQDWLLAYAKACDISRASIFRFKSTVEKFKTYRFDDGRSFMDFLREDSLEGMVEFFDEYFEKNPEASMKALYEWATGSVTQEIHDYVHTLFATQTTISLDRLKEDKERAEGRRLKAGEEKPLPHALNSAPQPTEIEAEVVPIDETPVYAPSSQKPQSANTPVVTVQEKPFLLGVEDLNSPTSSFIQIENAQLEELKNKVEQLEHERQVLDRQIIVLENECDRLEKLLAEQRSQDGVPKEMLIDWVENSNDYYFFQRVAVHYLLMAKSIADLKNPVTNKPYDKSTLKRVVLAQLNGEQKED